MLTDNIKKLVVKWLNTYYGDLTNDKLNTEYRSIYDKEGLYIFEYKKGDECVYFADRSVWNFLHNVFGLDDDEIKSYICHRLEIAGSNGRIEFSNEAINIISRFSSGTPRLINMICDRALLAGFVSQTQKIDFNIIKKCVEELDSYALGQNV